MGHHLWHRILYPFTRRAVICSVDFQLCAAAFLYPTVILTSRINSSANIVTAYYTSIVQDG